MNEVMEELKSTDEAADRTAEQPWIMVILDASSAMNFFDAGSVEALQAAMVAQIEAIEVHPCCGWVDCAYWPEPTTFEPDPVPAGTYRRCCSAGWRCLGSCADVGTRDPWQSGLEQGCFFAAKAAKCSIPAANSANASVSLASPSPHSMAKSHRPPVNPSTAAVHSRRGLSAMACVTDGI